MQQNKYTPLKFSLRLHNLRNLMEIQTSRFLESQTTGFLPYSGKTCWYADWNKKIFEDGKRRKFHQFINRRNRLLLSCWSGLCVSNTKYRCNFSRMYIHVIFFLDLKVNHLSSKAKNIKNITKESWINLFLFSSYSSYKVSYILIFLHVLFSTKYVARMVNMIH